MAATSSFLSFRLRLVYFHGVYLRLKLSSDELRVPFGTYYITLKALYSSYLDFSVENYLTNEPP